MEQAQKQQVKIISGTIAKNMLDGQPPKVFPITMSLPTGDVTEDGFKAAARSYIEDRVEASVRLGQSVGDVVKDRNFSPNELGGNALGDLMGNTVKMQILELGKLKADADMQFATRNYEPRALYENAANKLAATILVAGKQFSGTVVPMQEALKGMESNREYAAVVSSIRDMVKSPDVLVVAEIMTADRKFAQESFPKQTREIDGMNKAKADIEGTGIKVDQKPQ